MTYGRRWNYLSRVIERLLQDPLVGPIVETTVAEAPASRWAAGFVLRDATLRADLGGALGQLRVAGAQMKELRQRL